MHSFVHDYLPCGPYKDAISGVIFRPIRGGSNKNIIFNFPKGFKLFGSHISDTKEPEVNSYYTNFTIDDSKYPEVRFLLFETDKPDDYILKLRTPEGKLFQYGYALANDLRTSLYLQKNLSQIEMSKKRQGVCVLCRYNQSFEKWKPVKILSDSEPHSVDQIK